MTLEMIEGGAGLPQEPNWTEIFDDVLEQEAAHRYWLAIVTGMREADTIAAVNGHAVTRLVLAYIAFDGAARNVASEGAVTRKGRRSPSWMVMKQSAEMCEVLESELGLSPRRRASVSKVRRKPRKPTAAD